MQIRHVDVERFHQCLRVFGGIVPRDGADLRPAHGDGAMKQAFGRRHAEQRADLAAAAGLAEDRDVRGIAAEIRRVIAHPFQSQDDIEHAGVAGLRELLATEIGEVQIAEYVEAMVDGDDHDVVLKREIAAVIEHVAAAGAGRESAAVQPDHYGTLAIVLNASGEDVDAEVPPPCWPRCAPSRAYRGRGCQEPVRALADIERVLHVGPGSDLCGRHEAHLVGCGCCRSGRL